METGEPSSRRREEGFSARLDAEPILEQSQRISNPTERNHRAFAELFDTSLQNDEDQFRKNPKRDAGQLALHLFIFTKESLMSGYDIPENNPVFQNVTARDNRRNNSTELLAVTFPQWFFLAVTLGANNPSFAPVKEFMETHWGCEFSSKDIDFNALPAGKCQKLFADIDVSNLHQSATNVAGAGLPWATAFLIDSDDEASVEADDKSTITSGPGNVNEGTRVTWDKNIRRFPTPFPYLMPTSSDELDTPPDIDSGPSGSIVTDASAATIATSWNCDDTNSPGVVDGISDPGNKGASTAPGTGGSGHTGNGMTVIALNSEVARLFSPGGDEASVPSESLAQGIISSSNSPAAPSSAGAFIPSTCILPESNDNATDSSIGIPADLSSDNSSTGIHTEPSAHSPADSSAASVLDTCPVGVAVSSTANTANSSAANTPSVFPETIVPSANNSAGPFPANTASNIDGISLDQSSMNDRIRAAKDFIDSIYRAQDTITSLATNFQSLRQEVTDATQAKPLELKKVHEGLDAMRRGLSGDIEALRNRQDRLESNFESIHNRTVNDHRERLDAINEDMRRFIGEFRSDIGKIYNSHNLIVDQLTRAEEGITAIQNQVTGTIARVTAIENQVTDTVASVDALLPRISEMEQVLDTLFAPLMEFLGRSQELGSNNGGNKKPGEPSEHGNGKRQRTTESQPE
ncbi:hypothetical protein FGLOB1_11628 [Fusarium globosum]|uniref:Uncharacterized protein n=1 Tax=Fusarium globosum TaxID=78864 RepID=A0A8H6D0F3_9HYPO|nr:hypothetical protein FGLOB1_11628 [Fusarium globosum]